MVLGIVVAMPEEAAQVMNIIGLDKDKGLPVNENITLYTGDVYLDGEEHLVQLAVCGIGLPNSAAATSLLIALGCNAIANVGTCGTLVEHGKPGDVYVPDSVYYGEFNLPGCSQDPAFVNKHTNALPCYSYSHFVEDSDLKDCIVEMELYAVATIANTFNTPWVGIKIASDCADESMDGAFEENVRSVIERSKEEVKEALEVFVNEAGNFLRESLRTE